jgi:hypothetical protein
MEEVRTERRKWQNEEINTVKSLVHIIRMKESRTSGCAGHKNGRDFILKFIGQSSRVYKNTCRQRRYCH